MSIRKGIFVQVGIAARVAKEVAGDPVDLENVGIVALACQREEDGGEKKNRCLQL